jgi:predicted MFS family arabinose efflux permease
MLAIFCIGTDMSVVAALIPEMARDLGESVPAPDMLVSACTLLAVDCVAECAPV